MSSYEDHIRKLHQYRLETATHIDVNGEFYQAYEVDLHGIGPIWWRWDEERIERAGWQPEPFDPEYFRTSMRELKDAKQTRY